MPRVLPSAVVRAIDKEFHWAQYPGRPGDSHPGLGGSHIGAVAGVLDLAEHVPDRLLMLGPGDYADLLGAIAALRSINSLWQANPRFVWEGGTGDQHPIHVVRRLLARCPDEAPDPRTAGLEFLEPPDFRESVRADVSSANDALNNGEWKAATVLAGSVAEALLLWAIQNRSDPGAINSAVAGLTAPGGPLSHKPHVDPERWGLHEFTEVAAGLGLVEVDTRNQLRLATAFRNLIHPGRAARLEQKCDRGTALAAVAGVEFVVRDLS